MKTLIKAFLSIIPFKKNVFELIRNIFKPSEKVYRHLHFKGEIKLKIDSTHHFKMIHYGFQLENELFWSGLNNGWEKESVKIWLQLSKISNTILDIGANTGCFALMSAAVNKDAKLYAFEPVKRVCEKLKRNIEINNFNILPVEVALSNLTGTAIIYDQPTEHVYSVSVNKDISDTNLQTIPTQINTIRLDDFIRQHAIDQIELLKIDVETHEPEVLEGFGEYLEKFQPSLLIEILNDEIAAQIQSLISHLDYVYYNIDEDSGPQLVDRLSKSNSYNFLICKPHISSYLGLDS